MVRGLDVSTKSKLKLDTVDSFKILTAGECTTITTEQDDVNEFQAVSKALNLMGCTSDEISKIWELLACILHLGIITEHVTLANAYNKYLSKPIIFSIFIRQCYLLKTWS